MYLAIPITRLSLANESNNTMAFLKYRQENYSIFFDLFHKSPYITFTLLPGKSRVLQTPGRFASLENS